MMKFKLKMSVEDLASRVADAKILRLPKNWFAEIAPAPNTFEQFYRWLVAQGCAPGELHQRARVGDRLQRQLVLTEKKRLQTRKRSKGEKRLKGEELKKALWWLDFGCGPMETFAGRDLIGNAVCVLPPAESKAESDLQHQLVQEQIEMHAKHVMRLRARMKGETFYYWLLGAVEHDDRIGDLARDVAEDADFPKNAATYHEVLNYLDGTACEEAITCAEDAWLEYAEKYPERNKSIAGCCDACGKLVSEDAAVVFNNGLFSLLHRACEDEDDVDETDKLPYAQLFIRGFSAFHEFVEKHGGDRWYSSRELEKKLLLAGLKASKSVVYFIQSGIAGPIKIGYTATSVEKRVASLQTAHPEELRVLAIIVGGRDVEAGFHERFALFRKAGEWFEPHPEILAFLSTVAKK